MLIKIREKSVGGNCGIREIFSVIPADHRALSAGGRYRQTLQRTEDVEATDNRGFSRIARIRKAIEEF
jgi:hypothetical protein